MNTIFQTAATLKFLKHLITCITYTLFDFLLVIKTVGDDLNAFCVVYTFHFYRNKFIPWLK